MGCVVNFVKLIVRLIEHFMYFKKKKKKKKNIFEVQFIIMSSEIESIQHNKTSTHDAAFVVTVRLNLNPLV